MMSRLVTIIKRTGGRSWRFKLLLLPVLMLTGLMRGLLLLAPFRHFAKMMGTSVEKSTPCTNLSDDQARNAHEIGAVIEAVSRHTPWASNCLVQAMTALIILRLSGIPYHLLFGVETQRPTGRFSAHAWVRAGDNIVCGKTNFKKYSILAVYQSHKKQTSTR